MKKVVVPNGISGCKNSKAWMNTETMIKWLHETLKPWKHKTFGVNDTELCILILDSFSAHEVEDVKIQLLLMNVIPLYVPGGLTSLLQPLDISVNRSFKCKMRDLWNDSMDESDDDDDYDVFDPSIQIKNPHEQSVILDLIERSWNIVSDSSIINGFKKANLLV
jgi:hypothetical protein